jgi:potassium/hydrogen antiporter
MTEGQAILAAGALLAGALGASLLAGRIRVPGLLLFLGLGMLLGTDGLGWIDFNDYHAARTVGIVALALILFEGGLTAGYDEIRPVLKAAASLAVVGTIVTAVVAGLFAAWLFDLSTLEGLLVGSILASTDGAAIFAVLRGSTLRRRLARTLEGEAGFNDPVAVLLVLGFIHWVKEPDYGFADMACSGCSARAWPRPGCTPSPRWRSRPSRSAPPTRCTAPASSPSTWPASSWGPGRFPPSAPSPPSTPDSAGWPRW